MIFRKCKHEWLEISRSFTQPKEDVSFNFDGVTGPATKVERLYNNTLATVQSAMEGTTHIQLQCKRCGDMTARNLRGIHESK